jgi:hypothetical protein
VTRAAGIAALIAPVTVVLGWAFGALAQPNAYSSVHDDVSDLGALTAASPWLYNQVASNLTGLLLVVVSLGLWRALSPNTLGRVGAVTLAASGVGAILDGFFRLDCRGIDSGCVNDSWHAHAHKVESAFTAATILLAPLILAFAFRRIEGWRSAWLPTLAAIPGLIAAEVIFSTWGDGAATRAGTLVVFAWIAYLGVRLLRVASVERGPTAAG